VKGREFSWKSFSNILLHAAIGGLGVLLITYFYVVKYGSWPPAGSFAQFASDFGNWIYASPFFATIVGAIITALVSRFGRRGTNREE
jgi:hypothetical protein